MDTKILAELVNNCALLLAMCLVYDTLSLNRQSPRSPLNDAASGFVLGLICIAVMINPWQLTQGIIFDTRSILLSVSGLFFGVVPTVVAMVVSGAYRIYHGGRGVWMGISVILASGTIGIAWKKWRRKSLEDISTPELYTFGIIVHLSMLAFMWLLPGKYAVEALTKTAAPVIIIFPFVTTLLGKLMLARHRRKRAEESLRDSEERLQLEIDVSSGGIWDWDIRSDKMTFSDNIRELFGYEDHEIGGNLEDCINRLHPEDRERVMDDLGAALGGESAIFSSEHRMLCKDASYKWIMNRGKVVSRSADGEALRMLGTATDITELKNLEAQLYQAQKMEAVGQLAGGVAHVFNNILTAIIGFAHLIMMKVPEGDPLRNYVGQIRNCADRATELTQGLLAFSRKQMMVPRAVDLNKVVARLETILRRLISEDIELTVKTASRSLTVSADVGKIEQVLINLVTNARDAMPSGGSLDISTSSETMEMQFLHSHGFGKPGDYACITVYDSGLGMGNDTIKKIFEPFFTTKEVGKGTGLGLSVVYGIIKQHKGYITCYSEPGKGTSFKIYLPLVRARAAQEPDARRYSLAPGGNETLMLAEDDPAVRDFHKTLLENAGYKVITANDGEMALEMFVNHKDEINLLVLDLVMPKLGGKKLFDIFRQDKPGIKTLFMSGYSGNALCEQGERAGQPELLIKPVDPSRFLEKVREILDFD